MNARGFTLTELLIAMLISALLLPGVSRFLPLLTASNLRQLMALQLWDEMQLLAFTLEKVIRRAGYCHGTCRGKGLKIPSEGCLLIRWDGKSNGRWAGPASGESDYYGYRLRAGNLEAQRGVENCQGSGWEKLNDPSTIKVSTFSLVQNGNDIIITLEGQAQRWPELRQHLVRKVTRENRDVTSTRRQPA